MQHLRRLSRATIILATVFVANAANLMNATAPAGNGIRLCSIGYTPEVAKEATVVGAADAIVANSRTSAYGRGLRIHYWGCNGAVARTSMNLQSAYLVTGDKKYLDTAYDQIAYIFGRNVFCRSFVTGDGINPPMHPHHRPSEGDNVVNPWPGHLVGGPNPKETDWLDEMPSFRTNEFAINWDASLAYALSVFYRGE